MNKVYDPACGTGGMLIEVIEHVKRAARMVETAINLTGLVVSAFLAKISFDLAQFIYNSGQISPTLGVSMLGLYDKRAAIGEDKITLYQRHARGEL